MSATINVVPISCVRSLQGRNHHVNLVCQILFRLGLALLQDTRHTHVGGMGVGRRSFMVEMNIVKIMLWIGEDHQTTHIYLGETTATGNSSQT